ncbi:MAG: hypothetical protein K2J71_04680 [Oscillospiraceae bacterium]|nr:hypothetical protein [Oscillospiraceae bacterium]
MTNTQKIWDKLISAGMTKAGAAGLMGNLEAESALNPKNLQNTYEKSLGYTDESYTKAVDNGTYANFVKDCAGYGLAQWTYWARKQALLSYAKAYGKSIGDLDMQLDFLLKELSESYTAVLKILKTTDNVTTASDCVMCQYERPADTSITAKAYRASLGQKYYDLFADRTITGKPSKSIDEIAQEVLAGLWGDGSERKENLICSGYDYDTIQTEVNKILNEKLGKYFSISVDGKTYAGILMEEKC